MRYQAGHKAEIHQKIVKDASRRVRAEGVTGAAVSAVMRDAGLTHGGFYKHFESKDELLMESLGETFQEIAERLALAAEQSQPGTGWKAIVNAYLSPEHCDHAECGCPVAALAPELAIKKLDALGFSMGGFVAQQFTIDRPDLVRNLILVGTGPRSGEGMASLTREAQEIFEVSY